jgi:hypothetical protein
MNIKEPHEILRQKSIMINALEANYGNVRKSAKIAGISTQTHYRWRKEDEDYEKKTDNLKDIGFRDVKENLIEEGLKMVEKGNAAVLMKMMSIFLKNLPEEMKTASRSNNIPLTPKLRYVNSREEAEELARQRRMPPE